MQKYISLIPLICLITFAIFWRLKFVQKVLVPLYFSLLFIFCGIVLSLGPFIKTHGRIVLPLFGNSWYWIVLNECLGIFCLYIASIQIRIIINKLTKRINSGIWDE